MKKIDRQQQREQRQLEQTRKVAYLIYLNRVEKELDGDERTDWMMAEEICRSPLKLPLFRLHQWSHDPWRNTVNWWESTIIERALDTLVADLKNLAFLDLLFLLSNAAILITVITYLSTEKQRRDAEVYNAWQTITSADKTSGNGGRRRALEFLNASPANKDYEYDGAPWRRRFPWVCTPFTNVCPTWKQEDLEGLNVSGAYLADVQLPNAVLNNTVLQGTTLKEANLEKASFRLAKLQSADLRHANLQNTDFWKAQLQKSDLRKADLQKSDLRKADLQSAILRNAKLQNVNLQEANLQNANLREANLQDTELNSANLQGSILRRASLQDANLTDANLQGAKLGSANLQKANLKGANLQDAGLFSVDLRNANLQEADLRNANLQEANLQNANLNGADLRGAFLLSTNLRETKLDLSKLEGDDSPLLCNVFLPIELKGKIDRNRDCEIMPQVRSDRHGVELDQAKENIDASRRKTCKNLFGISGTDCE
ncbi:MAG: pentapeptide repeat-containing protein [Cyanothece sp. SIO2G6]|nr:pentapeptide repeat-containing protein [Cyanothece sp. SIO2G6]